MTIQEELDKAIALNEEHKKAIEELVKALADISNKMAQFNLELSN